MEKLNGIFIAIGLSLAGMFIGQSIIEFKKDRTIEVRGLAERDVKATEASWELKFRASAESIQSLNKKVLSNQNAIKQFLSFHGYKDNEVRTGSVTVSDNGQYNNNYEVNSRFSATGSVIVVSNKVDEIFSSSTKTDALLANDVMLEYTNLVFSYSKLNDIKPELLKESTANARQAAESLARDSNVELGKLRSASQGLFTIITPGSDSDDPSAINKRVRVVSKVVFDIKN
jgi:hypothetical protein